MKKTQPLDNLPQADLIARYQARLVAGRLKPDAAQVAALQAMQNLGQLWQEESRAGIFSLFQFPRMRKPLGFYLHGPVGRGKSMLMDLMAEQPPLMPYRREHFHAFMLQIQARLHAARHGGQDGLGDLARNWARDIRLLFLDEFHVSNIADAMILARLFSGLADAGVKIICTSNFAPVDLYKDGLQRARFEPFIAFLRERFVVFNIGDGLDYRRSTLSLARCWLVPDDAAARAELADLFARLTEGATGEAVSLSVDGRSITLACAARGVVLSDFNALCAQPLGSADYLALASRFHTVLVEGVPVFAPEARDVALRFVHLIDILYEHKCKLIISAAAMPDALYPAGTLAPLFARTASRLAEMASPAYLDLPHLG